MKSSLKAGLEHVWRFTVRATKTVPALYPESPEFQAMPRVFATGFLVGLLEWACIRAVNPHLDWPREQTVGTRIDVSHSAATPPGLQVTVRVALLEVQGRKLRFEVEAHDGVELISKGTHERFVIDATRFADKARRKSGSLSALALVASMLVGCASVPAEPVAECSQLRAELSATDAARSAALEKRQGAWKAVIPVAMAARYAIGSSELEAAERRRADLQRELAQRDCTED